jgi:hypothetical protein
MKIYIQKIAADARALDAGIQGRAQAALGIRAPDGTRGVEVFIRVGAGRTLIARKIVDRLPLSINTYYGELADFLAICRINPQIPQKIRWKVATAAGIIIAVNKELWDFEVSARDAPADFRKLTTGSFISDAVTTLPPMRDSFIRALWSGVPEDRVEMLGWSDGAAIPLTGFLTQDPRAPMLRFAVHARERSSPPAGTYANPQFVGTFGSGRRWEEARNPDIFYSLTHEVEIDNRRLAGAGQGLDSVAAFFSKSFWQCTTPISPSAWRSITFTVRFEQLPTAGEQPMRCVAAAYPFFVYIAYTPAGPGYSQGVYFYLYRLKGAAYTFCSRLPVERAMWYHVCLSFKDGQPGDVALSVRTIQSATASVRTFAQTAARTDHASLKVEDDVFYRPIPHEGGREPHMPIVSLGFHKYGGGSPGFTGHVGYFHIFDYLLGAADYERDLRGDWSIKWFN